MGTFSFAGNSYGHCFLLLLSSPLNCNKKRQYSLDKYTGDHVLPYNHFCLRAIGLNTSRDRIFISNTPFTPSKHV